MDLQGSEAVKPYTQHTSFKTVIDRENILANHYNFSAVPNGIFLDREGKIRLIKQGFKVTDSTHLAAVQQLIDGTLTQVDLGFVNISGETKSLAKQLAETKFKLACKYLKNEMKDMALQELDEALLLDPENKLIRKQRWHIRFPEKFTPTVDFAWQDIQMAKEKAEEAARCDAEGCLIPGRHN